VSTLWTPGGEYTPRREPEPRPGAGAAPPGPPPREHSPYGGDDLPPDIDPEMLAEAQRVRDQILNAPAADLVANHAIGLFEVAALHLGAERPKLDEAQLVIDAMAAIVDGLGARLGRHERVLRDGLTQLQMAFVEAKTASP